MVLSCVKRAPPVSCMIWPAGTLTIELSKLGATLGYSLRLKMLVAEVD